MAREQERPRAGAALGHLEVQAAAVGIAATLGDATHEVCCEPIPRAGHLVSLFLSLFQAAYPCDPTGRGGGPAVNNQGITMAFSISWELVGGREVDRRSTVAIFGRGPRFRLQHFLRSPCSDAPRSQVVVPGGRGPGPPGARLRAAAAGRHTLLRIQGSSREHAPRRARRWDFYIRCVS